MHAQYLGLKCWYSKTTTSQKLVGRQILRDTPSRCRQLEPVNPSPLLHEIGLRVERGGALVSCPL